MKREPILKKWYCSDYLLNAEIQCLAVLYLPKIMKQIFFFVVSFLLIFSIAQGSFALDVDVTKKMAIVAAISVFMLWAKNCGIYREYEDIAVIPLVEASFGRAYNVFGESGTNGLLSLGDGDMATLIFSEPIGNKNRRDFAIFENAFSNTFLELGFVEVSSDETNHTCFSSFPEVQIAKHVDGFGETDATMINTFAGKYRTLFGAPFALIGETNQQIQIQNHKKIR